MTELKNDRFLRALRREATDTTPDAHPYRDYDGD